MPYSEVKRGNPDASANDALEDLFARARKFQPSDAQWSRMLRAVPSSSHSVRRRRLVLSGSLSAAAVPAAGLTLFLAGGSARDVAWGSVLDAFAARKSLTLITFGLIVGAATLFLKMSGRLERNIDAAKGRMPTEG